MELVIARSSLVGVMLLLQSPGGFVPPKYLDGALPQNQILAVGGGEVFLEATIDPRGNVGAISSLRMTPPFTDPVRTVVQAWHFVPAEEQAESLPGEPPAPRKPVSSKVLIAAIFRAPTLNTPTFGEAPHNGASPSNEIPFPIATAPPLFPPRVLFDGVVLVEVLVGSDGRVAESKVVRSASAFDAPALDAVKQWRFRPARVHGIPTAAFAYIAFGFRQPITQR